MASIVLERLIRRLSPWLWKGAVLSFVLRLLRLGVIFVASSLGMLVVRDRHVDFEGVFLARGHESESSFVQAVLILLVQRHSWWDLEAINRNDLHKLEATAGYYCSA